MPGIQNKAKTISWLGNVGSKSRGDNVALNHIAQALVELGEFLITDARKNLDRGGNVASGQTASSMKISNLQTNATKMSLDVDIVSTYKFLDKGVKGVKGGSGKYSFKTLYPSKKMVDSIKQWIKNRRIVTKYKEISKTERTNKKIKKISDSAKSLQSAAYAISTNIKKFGIRPTYFFTNAITRTKKEQKKRFADAFKLDIIETLNAN